MPKEIDLWNTADTFLGVYDETVAAEVGKKTPEMVLMLLRGVTGHQNVVDASVGELKIACDMINEALKRLGGVA